MLPGIATALIDDPLLALASPVRPSGEWTHAIVCEIHARFAAYRGFLVANLFLLSLVVVEGEGRLPGRHSPSHGWGR